MQDFDETIILNSKGDNWQKLTECENTDEFLKKNCNLKENYIHIESRDRQFREDKIKLQKSKSLKSTKVKSQRKIEDRKGIYSDIENLLQKIENRSIDTNSLRTKMENDFQTLFSYKNFIVLNKKTELLNGVRLRDLKNERVHKLFKDYKKDRVTGQDAGLFRAKSKMIQDDVRVDSEISEIKSLLLPRINNSKSVSHVPFFDTEIRIQVAKKQGEVRRKKKSTLDSNMLSNTESAVLKTEQSRPHNDENTLMTKSPVPNKEDLVFLPPIINIKQIDRNMLPTIEKRNRFSCEDLNLILKIKDKKKMVFKK